LKQCDGDDCDWYLAADVLSCDFADGYEIRDLDFDKRSGGEIATTPFLPWIRQLNAMNCLLFMALRTIIRIISCKSLGAIMAFATELAAVYVCHLHLGRSFFHLEDLRMAVKTLEPLVSMHLAIEGNLAHGRIPLGGLTGRNRTSIS
jgi:hypothetical protein